MVLTDQLRSPSLQIEERVIDLWWQEKNLATWGLIWMETILKVQPSFFWAGTSIKINAKSCKCEFRSVFTLLLWQNVILYVPKLLHTSIIMKEFSFGSQSKDRLLFKPCALLISSWFVHNFYGNRIRSHLLSHSQWPSSRYLQHIHQTCIATSFTHCWKVCTCE